MNYCYMTLITNDSYLQGVVLLNQSLRFVKSKYPLVCLITEDVSKESKDILDKQGVTTVLVEDIQTPTNIYVHNLQINPKFANVWKSTFTKFHIWSFTQFDKIIFLDADLMITKNVDHCFELPDMTGAIDGDYFNLWPKYVHLNTGFFVFKPSMKVYMDLRRFVYTLDPEKFLDYSGMKRLIADQDLIGEYFSNWENEPEKHLSKYYNIFAPYITKDNEKDILDNCYFIHFTGCKPWRSTDGYPDYSYDTGRDFKSKIAYEVAQGIISYVYKHNFENIDWEKDIDEVVKEMINICIYIKDEDGAKKISKHFNVDCKFIDQDKKKILRDLFMYLYKNGYYSGAYMFETINQIDRDEEGTIDFIWSKITDSLEKVFGRF